MTMGKWDQIEAELDRDTDHAAAAELEPWEQIVRRLIRYRIEQGITQTDLARRCGISQPAIARLESAKHEPKLSTLRKVAHALGGELVINLQVKDEHLQVKDERHELATI